MRNWMTKALRHVVPDDKKLFLKFVDQSLLIAEHDLMEIWLVTFVAKACLSSKPSKWPEIAEGLKVLEYISAARSSTHGNVGPAGHPGSVTAAPPMAKLPDGSRLMGWILQVMTNATSSGSITSGNDGSSEAIGRKGVYQNGKILAITSLRIFTYSELQDAPKTFRSIDKLLGIGKFGRVPQSNSLRSSLMTCNKFCFHCRRSSYSLFDTFP